MSESSSVAGTTTPMSPMRNLAVRMSDDLRAQLDVIAQLNDRSVTEEIRIALEAWVETSKSDPKVLQRAETVRAEIEREAKTKQSAIEAIFGTATATKVARGKPATARAPLACPGIESSALSPGARLSQSSGSSLALCGTRDEPIGFFGRLHQGGAEWSEGYSSQRTARNRW